MRHNVEVLQRMTDHLDDARQVLESINREEALLDFDETNFPLLQAMFHAKDPYDKLWTTALNFTVKSEDWMNGNLLLFIVLQSLQFETELTLFSVCCSFSSNTQKCGYSINESMESHQ